MIFSPPPLHLTLKMSREKNPHGGGPNNSSILYQATAAPMAQQADFTDASFV